MGSADSNFIVALIVILAFSALVSTFSMPLVEEHRSNFKHQVGLNVVSDKETTRGRKFQLLLTKMSKLMYWISYILWHLIVYTLFCAAIALLFLVFSWMEGCMFE